MAKVRLNPLIQGIHGRIGDLIFRDSANGETIVYKAPERTDTAAESQPHPFTAAHAFARSTMDDPEMKAYYEREAQKKHRSAYRMALSNYFKVQRRLRE